MRNYPHCITPDWNAPPHVQALCTTRTPPVLSNQSLSKETCSTKSGYAAFNLGLHVGDNQSTVEQNRHQLARITGLNQERFYWLNQVHGQFVAEAGVNTNTPEADASATTQRDLACVIMTADCLPILLTDEQGTWVAAVHAGWRSLASGIITNTLAKRPANSSVIAWLGPAISQKAFEVGAEVREAFCAKTPKKAEAFIPSVNEGKWMADLYQLARIELADAGVTRVYGGQHCTFTEADTFYSYRRDGAQSGRMASLIWLNGNNEAT